MRGGKREGSGRKPVPDQLRKEQIGLKLPRWLIDWLDTRPESRAVAIEHALAKVHKLKRPGP